MPSVAVLGLPEQLPSCGAAPPLVLVGCEPASIEEGMELSQPVSEAVEPAAALVRRIVAGESLLGKDEREIAWSAI